MQPYKILSYFALISIVLMSFSCKKEEERKLDPNEFPPLDKGDIQVDNIQFITENRSTLELDTFYFSESNLTDTISFTINYTFNGYLKLFDNENEVTDNVEANYKDYIACYMEHDNNVLRLDSLSRDPDDKILGLKTKWSPVKVSTKADHIRLTLNYQSQRKENLCNAGVKILELNLPYKIIAN